MSTRSWWSRRLMAVAAFSVLLSMVAMPAAHALTSEACPTSIPAAGFTDLGGLSADAVDAIDCVKFYGIALGTSTTKFSPSDSVSRWQMALFLIRTAEDIGIVLPSGVSQGFTDIGGYGSDVQKAINQLAQLDITQGTTVTTFAPAATVSRWQMALFLTRLYTKAGFVLPSGTAQGFNDISAYPSDTQKAINQLAQLGIATGTTASTYSPGAVVFRWQMALFLARELDSTKAKPYTVTVAASSVLASTADTVTLTVTVKNANGTAANNISVDVFVGTLKSDGTCTVDTDAKLNGGDEGTGTDCKIDSGDPKTNTSGIVTVAFTHTTVQETDKVYAWIGETGETFDDDLVRTKASIDVIWGPAPAAIVATDVIAKFGTTAVISIKFIDGTGATVALANQTISVKVKRGSSTIKSADVVTNGSGIGTYSYVGPADPSGGDDAIVLDIVTVFWDKDGDGVDDGTAELDDTSTVTWDDDLPRADNAVLSATTVSRLSGSSHAITIKVTDKFGSAVSGAVANWTVTGVNTDSGTTGTTNSSGIATFTYVAANPGEDSVDAEVDVADDGSIDIGFGSVSNLTVFTVDTAPSLAGSIKFDIIAVDTSADTIDVKKLTGGTAYYRLTYDNNNDSYTVSGLATTRSAFETALNALTLPDLDGSGGTVLETNPYSSNESDASTWILTP